MKTIQFPETILIFRDNTHLYLKMVEVETIRNLMDMRMLLLETRISLNEECEESVESFMWTLEAHNRCAKMATYILQIVRSCNIDISTYSVSLISDFHYSILGGNKNQCTHSVKCFLSSATPEDWAFIRLFADILTEYIADEAMCPDICNLFSKLLQQIKTTN